MNLTNFTILFDDIHDITIFSIRLYIICTIL